MVVQKNKFSGWGNYPVSQGAMLESEGFYKIQQHVSTAEQLTARGNGKSYGDSALGTCLLSSLRLNKILNFDKNDGCITCESGVLLSQILERIVNEGYFLPVVPGTQWITIGGAIASDVHGKNHIAQGSFSKHVTEIKLLLACGNTIVCSKTIEPDLFWATVGGMGLTGFILEATFLLSKIQTAYLQTENIFCQNLSQIFRVLEEKNTYEYKVTWLDTLNPKNNSYRGIVSFARHLLQDELSEALKQNPFLQKHQKKYSVPFFLPSWFLNWRLIKFFNLIKWDLQLRVKNKVTVSYPDFFFPLDSILHWNRIYGRNGFLQYQFVLPNPFAEEGTQKVLDELFTSNDKCLLAVIKQFGECDEHSLLSFPLKGFTVSLDFKRTVSLFALLNKLDEIVLKYGGRIYLAKDARMSLTTMEKGYAKLKEFQNVVKKFNPTKKFISAQAERIGYIK